MKTIHYYELYRYCTKCEVIVMGIGLVVALCLGFCQPLTFYAFGEFTSAMIEKAKSFQCTTSQLNNTDILATKHNFMSKAHKFVIFNFIIGGFQFILGYCMVLCFNIIAENQSYRIRNKYFKSLIHQEIAYFDTEGKRDFGSRIVEDILKIQEAMSEKLGTCAFLLMNFFALTIQSFINGWKLALVLTFIVPVIAMVTWFQGYIHSILTSKELNTYSNAGSIVEEALTNIRTVHSFNGAQLEQERFEAALIKAKKFSYQKNFILGVANGINWFFCFFNYSLAFYYGTVLVVGSRESGDGIYGPSNLVVVFFGVLVAAYNIGSTMEYFETFASGTGAATQIFSLLDRESKIDSSSEEGLQPTEQTLGEIVFENVEFSYPSRTSGTPVLKSLWMKINPGQTIALVGKSGCGKSTCVNLIQRFYDPDNGRISLDGIDIRQLNLKWLRSQIGFVSQEPILFNNTIYENIAMGKPNCKHSEVIKAAKKAFAHDFITNLPEGYYTTCGENGHDLSGGQKQRIAIARSLIRNPPILLFDEATSALDLCSERIVQAALDRAKKGRTTIIIAHRLSTIKAADIVFVLDEGKIVQQGTHNELMELKGIYYDLVTNQEYGKTPSEAELLSFINNNPPSMDAFENGNLLFNKISEEAISSIRSEDSIKSRNAESSFELKRRLENEDRKNLLKSFRLTRFCSFINLKEWIFLSISVFCTFVKSINIPFYCYIFGKYITLFALDDNAKILSKGKKYAYVFFGIGVVTGFSSFFQKFFAGLSGDSISMRVRKISFKHLLKQDLTYFSETGNGVGQLTARLSTDATGIQGATSSRLVGLVQAFAIISFSVVASIYLIPTMGIFVSFFVPLSVASAFLEGKILSTSNVAEKESVERSAAVAVEALRSIRTVASLGVEQVFIDEYKKVLDESHRINKKRAHVRALIFGFVYAIPYFGYSLSLWYGAYLIDKHCANVSHIFMIAEALIYGIGSAGSALAYAPDYEKGKISSARIFRILDRKPAIDSNSHNGIMVAATDCSIQLQNVSFHYGTRKDHPVLDNLSLSIEPGEKVGLVGASGCGKSTVVDLIQRFYDPEFGSVFLNKIDMKSMNLYNLRSHMSIVQQEPSLFARTIAENIQYGDLSRIVPMDEVIKSAKMAKIHDFIVTLPSGYETNVGGMGTLLSGGQKQRIAIARSLVKKPKLLILDEATSALDTESEKYVEEALDNIQNDDKMTVLTISHRLTSILNCNKIFVLVNGKISEEGTHRELIEKRGTYFQLWSTQTR